MAKGKEDGDVIIVLAANMPLMTLRLFVGYLRMKNSAKRAGKEFYRALVQNGVPAKQAKELRSEYEEALSVRRMLKIMTS